MLSTNQPINRLAKKINNLEQTRETKWRLNLQLPREFSLKNTGKQVKQYSVLQKHVSSFDRENFAVKTHDR